MEFEELQMDDIKDKVVLLSVAQTYKSYMDESVIYDVAKQAWSLDKNDQSKDVAEYALAIYQNRVVGVFSIDKWKRAMFENTKWEFEGKIASDDVRSRYLNKKIVRAFGEGQYESFRYLNCNPNN